MQNVKPNCFLHSNFAKRVQFNCPFCIFWIFLFLRGYDSSLILALREIQSFVIEIPVGNNNNNRLIWFRPLLQQTRHGNIHRCKGLLIDSDQSVILLFIYFYYFFLYFFSSSYLFYLLQNIDKNYDRRKTHQFICTNISNQ